jgi:phage terminase small subunit
VALTAQQELFCRELVACKFNATEAYRRAYPKSKPAAAQTSASRLLSNAMVQARVAEIASSAAEQHGVTPARVIRELEFIAFQRNSQIYHPDGSLKAPHEWDEATDATIAGVESVEEVEYDGTALEREPQGHGGELARKRGKLVGTVVRKVKRWNKEKALELFMRHFGMLKEDAPHPDRPRFDLSKLSDEAKRFLLVALRSALGTNPT